MIYKTTLFVSVLYLKTMPPSECQDTARAKSQAQATEYFVEKLQQNGTVQQRQRKSSQRPQHLFWSTPLSTGSEDTPALQPLQMVPHCCCARASTETAGQSWAEHSRRRWGFSTFRRARKGLQNPLNWEKGTAITVLISNGHIPCFSVVQGLPKPAYLPSSNTGCNSLSNFSKSLLHRNVLLWLKDLAKCFTSVRSIKSLK